MNIEINPDYEKSTTLRALSAFLTLLADEADGSTKDSAILSAIVQKGLQNTANKLDGVIEHFAAQIPKTATEVVAQQAEHEATINAAMKPPVADEVEQPAPPKRTRRTKAEMAADAGNVEAAPAANTSQAPSPAPGAETAVAPTTTDITIDDVRAALQRYTAAQGMDDGIALLKNYGAGRISELGVEQYPLFIAECDAVEA